MRPTGGNPQRRRARTLVAEDVSRTDERGACDEQRSADSEDAETVAPAWPRRRDAGGQHELRRAGAQERARLGVVEDRDVGPESLPHTPTF